MCLYAWFYPSRSYWSFSHYHQDGRSSSTTVAVNNCSLLKINLKGLFLLIMFIADGDMRLRICYMQLSVTQYKTKVTDTLKLLSFIAPSGLLSHALTHSHLWSALAGFLRTLCQPHSSCRENEDDMPGYCPTIDLHAKIQSHIRGPWKSSEKVVRNWAANQKFLSWPSRLAQVVKQTRVR